MESALGHHRHSCKGITRMNYIATRILSEDPITNDSLMTAFLNRINMKFGAQNDVEEFINQTLVTLEEKWKLYSPKSKSTPFEFVSAFWNEKAVENLSFMIYEGQAFCLLGHNEARKTTTRSSG